MATPLTSAESHRLAEECRARAVLFVFQIIRERMLMIADGYDRIAHDAASRAFGSESRHFSALGPCPLSARLSGVDRAL